MRARAVLIVGLAALVVAAVVVLSQSEQRRAGTNNVPPVAPVAFLLPGDRICQQTVVPDAARLVALRVPANERRQRRIDVRLAGVGGERARGRYRRPAPNGGVRIRLRGEVPVGAAELCVANGGATSIALLGFEGAQSPGAQRGVAARGLLSVEYWRGGSETWWAVAPAVAERAGFGRGVPGGLALWAAVALLLGACGTAAAALWRPEGRG